MSGPECNKLLILSRQNKCKKVKTFFFNLS